MQLGSAVYGLNVCTVSLGKIDLWKLISYMIHGLIESQILRVRSFGVIRVRISDLGSVWICLDHGASKEPVNPLWSWIPGSFDAP